MRHIILRHTAIAAACALLVITVPTIAGATPQRGKHLNADGSVPRKWNLPTPELASDDSTPVAAGGTGDGENDLSFVSFDDGDIVCAFPGSTLTGHAGIWSDALHTSPDARCVWSANLTPVKGVQREAAVKFNGYDYAYGLWVPTRYAFGRSAVSWCAAQLGEPYDIMSSKTDYARWYCSKLAWAGWMVRAGVDLDGNGGYWVKPADLVNDSQTSTFAYAD